MLEVHELTRCYGSFTAVDHLSFSLRRGQVLGFLGRNGAGKSTTMQMIAGYLSPTSGKILWDGSETCTLGAAFHHLFGYLPEVPPLYPELTVMEMLLFVCGLKRIEKHIRKKHVLDICEKLQLTDRLTNRIHSLSKGYRQRVGIALALIGDPELLILDEPTSGLDPEQMVMIRELIRELGKEKAILISSHLLTEIEDVATSLLIIHHGHAVASGTAPEIASAHFSGDYRLHLIAQGEEAIRKLLSIPGILSCERHAAHEVGFEDLTLVTSRDLTAEAGTLIIQSGGVLHLLQPLEANLEDVFLKLTGEEALSNVDSHPA